MINRLLLRQQQGTFVSRGVEHQAPFNGYTYGHEQSRSVKKVSLRPLKELTVSYPLDGRTFTGIQYEHKILSLVSTPADDVPFKVGMSHIIICSLLGQSESVRSEFSKEPTSKMLAEKIALAAFTPFNEVPSRTASLNDAPRISAPDRSAFIKMALSKLQPCKLLV